VKRLATWLAIHATGTAFAQGALEGLAARFALLRGVGSGGEVESSGELAALALLRRRVTGSCTVFDAGANVGDYAEAVLGRCRDLACRVHCFEPGAAAYRHLCSRHGGKESVVLNKIALGREAGEATLWYDREGSGSASLTKRDLAHFGIDFGMSETVAMTTIDHYCSLHAVPRIDLLKLDVEGHELDVLAGAETMFQRRAIDMVMFEFGGCNIDTRTFVRDFWQFFSAREMQLYRITPSGYLHRIDRYQESLEQFRTTNFLAVGRHGGLAGAPVG
jgi:FkbM family methyltransferase